MAEPRVIIVGAGPAGVRAAEALVEAGLRPMLVDEGRAREIWGRIPELLGEDVEFRPTGYLRCCYDPDQVGVLEDYARQARAYGL